MTNEGLASAGGPPIRERFLPVALPAIAEEEEREILDALRSGWITTGPRTKRLEEELAVAVGASHVTCLSSCTAALHLALVSLDLQPGDEVVTTPLTYCSTVNMIVHAGGTPVLADVEPDTRNLSATRFAEAITERTRAVIPVHLGGHPCDMDAFLEVARDRGIDVIEDAAHAVGARYRERPIGSIGDVTCFSFYATKNMTTGEGGAVATEDAERAARMRILSAHGISRDAWKRKEAPGAWFYEVVEPGYKYNMSDLNAAVGLHQLRRLEEFIARRRAIARRYDEGLGALAPVEVPAARPDVEHAYHLYAIRLRTEQLRWDRARVIEELRAENIGTTVNFIPIHFHPYYRERFGFEPGALPVAESIYEGLISLPMFPRMSDADADDVIAAVGKVLRAAAR